MFNALRYTQELEKAGFSRDQAEASVKLLIDVMNDNFATKSDLNEVKMNLSVALSETEKRLSSTILTVQSDFKELKSFIREVEYKMTIKLGTMMVIAIGVTATLVKLLPNLH